MSSHKLRPAQKTAVELVCRDILVTAGAGTGKTTVLIERILHKLRSKAIDSLDDILVVTFTEKAAKEMKDRLYKEMTHDSTLRRFLPQLPRAWISTIDSFCARLLRERFLEAAVEPSFRVISEHGREEALDDALRRVFHDWYRRGEQTERRRFLSLVEMAGFDEEGEVLRRVIRSIYDFSRVTPDPEAYLDSLLSRPQASSLEELPWYVPMADTLFGTAPEELRPSHTCSASCTPAQQGESHLDMGAPAEPANFSSEALWTRALALYRSAVNLAEPKRPAKMRRFLDLLEAVPRSELRMPSGQRRLLDSLVAADLIGPDGTLAQALPRAPGGANEIPGFKDLHEAAKALFKQTALAHLPWKEEELFREDKIQRESLQILVRIVRDVDRLYMQYKLRHGYLDFSDLEIHAARLIRDHGESLGWRDRFSEVLVDEFQDVNPLQDKILSAFCRPDSGFRVGDVKQSIYQFRLADPSIFLNLAADCRTLRDPFEKPGGLDPLLLFLGENFRSRPEILRFVNRVFSNVFDEGIIGSSYKKQELIPGRAVGSREVPIELHLLARPEARQKSESSEGSSFERAAANADRPDRREAVVTAMRIRRLIEEEKPRIPVSDTETRPATYDDVAILLRSRGKADMFLQALEEAGVQAYRQEGGSLVQEEGVRDLRSLLSVIDNPRDDVALAAILRSPLVGIDDGDLVRIRLAWPKARTFLDAVSAVAYGDDPGDDRGVFVPPAEDSEHSDGNHFWTGPPGDVPDDWIPGRLRERIKAFMDRLAGWRLEQGRMELGRFLHKVAVESGFDAMLLGRPDPALQRAAVERFISLARAFEAERGPSLHGFLARISLQETAGTLDGISRSQEGHNAVAVLTVHKAKGLEFPIVVLPQLQWGFRRDSLGDRIRVGEKWIGLRELDFESWGRLDTWPRRTLELLQNRRQREEEARILYVALTRAKERLILVATPRSQFAPPEQLPQPSVQEMLIRERCLTASSALDWILASIPWNDLVEESDGGDSDASTSICMKFSSLPLLIWSHPAQITARPADEDDHKEERCLERRRSLLSAISFDSDGDMSLVQSMGEETICDMTYGTEAELGGALREVSRQAQYPPLADLDDLKGKYWVTELKGPLDLDRGIDLGEEGSGLWLPTSSVEAREGVPHGFDPGDKRHRLKASRRGTAYHAALSRLDLSAVSAAALDAQFSRMSEEPWWDGVERDPAIEFGVASFFGRELGMRLCRASKEDPEGVIREAAFSLRLPVRELALLQPQLAAAIEVDPRWSQDPWAGVLDSTWVLVQGRVDCVFREGKEWTLIDWKTDRISSAGLGDRVVLYTDQMRIYTRAVRQLWGPVSAAWLVFPIADTDVSITTT